LANNATSEDVAISDHSDHAVYRNDQTDIDCSRVRTHHGTALSHFLTPPVVADHRNAPVNALGYLRVMFAVVDDIDEMFERLRNRGAQLVGEVVRYQESYRLGSATCAGLKGFSSGSPRNSAKRNAKAMIYSDQCQ
jgi:hypothetical protein